MPFYEPRYRHATILFLSDRIVMKIKRLCLEAKKIRPINNIYDQFHISIVASVCLELMLMLAAAGLTKLEIFYEAFFALFQLFLTEEEREE